MTKGEQGALVLGIGFTFRGLKGQQDAPANFGGILDGLETGGQLFPLVVSEIMVLGPGRQDEIVISQLAVAEQHPLAGHVDIDNLGQKYAGVLLPLEDVAQRGGNVGRAQAAGSHLVEQRLKQVKVAPVEQRDPHRRLAQGQGGIQAPEAAADNDDMRSVVHHWQFILNLRALCKAFTPGKKLSLNHRDPDKRRR
jgi:hypothetical protein